MAEKLRHWEIGPGRATTEMPPYPDHRTLEMVEIETNPEYLPRWPEARQNLIELRKNVARRRKPLLDVGGGQEEE